MTLREKQSLFVILQADWVKWVYSLPGVELTEGEGYDDDGIGHMPGSLHYLRLAKDWNLFVNGEYISGSHPVWEKIGAKWETLHPLCRWGGRFVSRDYNHISLTHGGKA